MKSSEVDILVIPGYRGSPAGHWQHRIVEKLSTAAFVGFDDWLFASLPAAIRQLSVVVKSSTRPVIFITHSLGGVILAHAMPALIAAGQGPKMRGGFLVTPPSEDAIRNLSMIDPTFHATPREPLPFPSNLIASSNDPFATLEQSADLALAWGSQFVEAGEAGHINMESGHGPWPEGVMRFAGFLSRLPV